MWLFPLQVLIIFSVEFILCCLYAIFMMILLNSKYLVFKSPFFKLFYATGFVGIGMVVTNWLITTLVRVPIPEEYLAFVMVSEVTNGSTAYSYTIGKLLIVFNRLSVFKSIKSSRNLSNNRTNRRTNLMIFCQYSIPLIVHAYFIFAPGIFIDGFFKGLEKTTGSIYRGLNGGLYLVYVSIGIAFCLIAIHTLRGLLKEKSFSSVSLFKQQRYLAIYTLASTASHTIFALTQFLWAYSFIVSDWELLTFVRNTGPFIYDLTTFRSDSAICTVEASSKSDVHENYWEY